MIYSILNKPERVPTNPGTEYINTYQEVVNKHGKQLEKTGQTNVYEMIQLDKDACNIEKILHQAAMGDLSVLQQREVTYCDATTLPKTLMEAQNLQIKAEQEFYEFPIEVRRLFNNSPEQYVSEMGSKEFMEKLAPYNQQLQAIEAEKNHKEYLKKVQEGAKLNIDIEREMAAQKGVTNE